jgi:hypothetical protein
MPGLNLHVMDYSEREFDLIYGIPYVWRHMPVFMTYIIHITNIDNTCKEHMSVIF